MVVAYDAVTIRWRVLWFVTPVAMPRRVEQPATAPDSVAASFTLNRSEMNPVPSPMRSASATSSNSTRGSSGAPASR